jgi:hypothetical protein
MAITWQAYWNQPRYNRQGNNALTYRVGVKLEGPLWKDDAIKKPLNKAIKRTLEYGKGVIKERTPVKTGLLKSQWFYRTEQRAIFNEVPYSIFVEYGTRFMFARMMAQNSIPDIQGYFEQAIAEELQRAL